LSRFDDILVHAFVERLDHLERHAVFPKALGKAPFYELVTLAPRSIRRGLLCVVSHLFVRQKQVDGISDEKLIQSKNCRSLVSVTEDVPASNREKQTGGLVKNSWVKFLAKASLKGLLRR
jgi:hypothetical protein